MGDDDYEPPLVLSMEEYDKQFPYEPLPSRIGPLRSNEKNSDHTVLFWQECQSRGLKLDFEYHEYIRQNFHVTLKVNDQTIGEIGPYASKKDAKNEICREYLPMIETFGTSRRSADKDGMYAHDFNQICQQRGLRKELEYHEVSKAMFHVTLKINGQTISQLGPFASKKDARNEIFRQNIDHLQEMVNGKTADLSGSVSSTEKCKAADSQGGVNSADEFNTACQERGLRAEFDYQEPSPYQFNVTLKIDGQSILQLGPFASKKDAKREICRQCLPTLDALFGNPKKRKSSEALDESLPPPEGIIDEEWIGILSAHVTSHKRPQPTYQITGVHPSQGPWTCQVSFSFSDPESNSPDAPTFYTFGHDPDSDSPRYFRRKDVAKKYAAMQAVKFLRDQGRMPATTTFHNPCKPAAPVANNDIPAQPPIPVPASASDAEPSPSTSSSNLHPSTPNPPDPTTATIGSKITTLSHALGLSAPEFRIEQHANGSFLDMWAVFSERDVRYEPSLAGEVGRVTRVFGKKAAKEECGREVLRVLGEVWESRKGEWKAV